MILYPNAKINLGLNVVSKRTDGYHNIQTVFVPVALCDQLQIERADTTTFNPTGIGVDCEPMQNLIMKTVSLFRRQFNIGDVKIDFCKRIPFGAGLGGGSSDAAHTALALNRLFNLNLTNKELKNIVSSLGADCAFFIENSTCYAEGIGDILTPINLSLDNYNIVLVKPQVEVSTKEAYQGIKVSQPKVHVLDAIKEDIHRWKTTIRNDFEDSVFPQHKEIAAVKNKLYELGAVYASMTGSGACVYGIFKDKINNIEQLFPDCFCWAE